MKTATLAALAVLFAGAAVLAEPRSLVWDYRNAERTPENWNAVALTPQPGLQAPDGGAVIELNPEYDRDRLQWPSFLIFPVRSDLFAGARTVAIGFWVKGEKGTELALRVTENAPRSTHYSPTRSYAMTGEWQRVEFREKLFGQLGGRWINAPRLLLEKNRAGQRYYLGPLTATFID